LSALSTHKAILTDLLIRRFEKSVSGGLDQINNAGKNVEGRTSGWEERLGKLEIRTNSAEEKIGAYASSLQQYQVAFGFLGLSAAFRQFFRRKWWERTILLIGLILFFIAIVCVPFIAHQTAEKAAKTRAPQPALAITDDANAGKSNAPKDAAAKAAEAKKGTMPIRGGRTQQAESEGSNDSVWLQLRPYLPFTMLELLLIYFFRVILMHFNSTQVQMLQLEIRMAACAFIDEYVKFVREHGKPDLSKFESLVFGGIAADSDKLPSTFDGIEQLASLVKEIRTAKR